MTAGPAVSPQMRRLAVLGALTQQQVARRGWLVRLLMRSGLAAHNIPLPPWWRRGLDIRRRPFHDRETWRLARVDAAGDAPWVVFIHGGAHAIGMTPPHWRFVTRLARAGAVVEAPMPGLVPRHDYRDARRLLSDLWDDIARPGRTVVLMGDSAGGGLALTLAQQLRDEGRPLPARLVLISPWVDLGGLACPMDERLSDDPMLTRDAAVLLARAWAAGTDLRDPAVSPLFGAMQGLPPTDIYQGTRDMLHPQVEALALALRTAGVAVDMSVCPGAVHDYPLFLTPEGEAATARILARLPRPAG